MIIPWCEIPWHQMSERKFVVGYNQVETNVSVSHCYEICTTCHRRSQCTLQCHRGRFHPFRAQTRIHPKNQDLSAFKAYRTLKQAEKTGEDGERSNFH